MKLQALISLDSGHPSLVTKSWAKSVGIDPFFLSTAAYAKTCRLEFEFVSNPHILIELSFLARPLIANCISSFGITFSFSEADLWLLKDVGKAGLIETDCGGAFLFVPMSNIASLSLLRPISDQLATSSPRTYAAVLKSCLMRDFSPSARHSDSLGHLSPEPSYLCF